MENRLCKNKGMRSDRITQNRRILGYMRTHKKISPLVALNRLGVMRLGARIWELKRDGHSIEKSMIKNSGKHYAAYSLIG